MHQHLGMIALNGLQRVGLVGAEAHDTPCFDATLMLICKIWESVAPLPIPKMAGSFRRLPLGPLEGPPAWRGWAWSRIQGWAVLQACAAAQAVAQSGREEEAGTLLPS